jgi:hypothetical protein
MKITLVDIARATLELTPAWLLMAYFVLSFAGFNGAAHLAALSLAAVIGFFLVFKIGIYILSRQPAENAPEISDAESNALN